MNSQISQDGIARVGWESGDTARQATLNGSEGMGPAHTGLSAHSLLPTASYFVSSHIPGKIVPEGAHISS